MSKHIQLFGSFVRAPKVKEDGDQHFVKGFLSTNRQDQDNDLLPPEAFDLDSFMQLRTVLYDHKKWKDENGNALSIGEVISARRAKLVEKDDALWSVKDIDTGEVFDEFPKDRVKDLMAGDRGVFIKARVDIPTVWERIKKGVLNGFSWSGESKLVKAKIGKFVRDIAAVVRMNEVSVVFTPAQPEALFVMSKSWDGDSASMMAGREEFVPHCFVFSPTIFKPDGAVKWLKSYHFDSDAITVSEDGEVIATQLGLPLFEPTSLLSVKMERGVQAFVGVLRDGVAAEMSPEEIADLTKRLFGCTVSKMEDDEMSRRKMTKAVDEKPVESVAVEPAEAVVAAAPVTAPEVAPVVEVKAEVAPEVQSVAVSVDEPVVAEVAPPVDVVAGDAPPIEAQPAVAPDMVKADAEPQTKRDGNPLTAEDAVDKIASLTGQQVATVVKAGMAELLAPIQSLLTNLTGAVEKMVNVSTASAQAVTNLLKENKPATVMSKSKETQTVNEKEVTAIQSEITQLKGLLRSMQKAVVTEYVRDEAPQTCSQQETKHPNDVFPKNWPWK